MQQLQRVADLFQHRRRDKQIGRQHGSSVIPEVSVSNVTLSAPNCSVSMQPNTDAAVIRRLENLFLLTACQINVPIKQP